MNRPIAPVALLGAATLFVALVGCQNASQEDPEIVEAPVASAPAEAPASVPMTGELPAEGTLLDPNQATREELLALPSMNEAVADAIIAGRPYDDMVTVDRVLATHLGEAEREVVYGRVWRPLDLNTANGEEILLVPGVGERMRHEFEEYRPYQAMEQFRREIGKYVDDDEVARLERYVTIR